MSNLQETQDYLNRLQQESDNVMNQNRRHRYVFEKYNPKIGKHICPRCQHKSFVYYQDTFNNDEIVSPIVGKCEKTNECKYWKTPYEYFNENGTDESYYNYDNINGISDLSEGILNSNRYDSLNDYEPLILCDYIPEKYLKHSFKNCANSFTVFLHEYLNKDTQKLLNLIKMYNIGTLKNSDVIFWQVDIKNNIRTGKIMRFNEKDKRWKNYINWAHKRIGIEEFNMEQCLYGEHLLTQYPQARQIIIVESDKTSILLKSEYLNDNNIIVMSAGSQEGLTLDKFKVFEDLQVEITLIPDVGAQDKWKRKMNYIKSNLKLDIELYDPNQYIIMNFNDDFTLEKGEDIGDYLIYKKLGVEYITEESYKEEYTNKV